MRPDWLDDARKIPGDVMSYLRKLAVDAVETREYSPESVANVLGISRSSLYEWLRCYREGGYDALDTRYPPGAEPLITAEMDEWLTDTVISTDPTQHGYDTLLWTGRILAELLEKRFGVKVRPGTVAGHLKDLDLSYQKPEYRASERDDAEIDRFLNEKFPRIERLAQRIGAEIAFEDEAGVEGRAHIGKTWGARGKTPRIRASGRRTKMNALSLVTAQGHLEYALEEGRIDSDVFIDFLKRVTAGRTRPLILLLDRVSFHVSKKVRQYVRENRARIRIYFLPKYAPEHNPAEQLWQEIKKNRLGKQSIKNQSDLRTKLKAGLEAVKQNAERVRSFFQTADTSYAAN
ncbi:MAG TPA: IS630 family transposase [Polyangiales bacterium]|nr:IS630 family transposase [Polyangiales bacterium]